jgi:hypothetical protein
LQATSWAPPFAAWGAGFTRTAYETYLPAFFIAGLLCLIGALAVVTIREPKVPEAQPQPA